MDRPGGVARIGSKFSRFLLSAGTNSPPGKTLGSNHRAHHPVYHYSHYILKIKSSIGPAIMLT